MRWKYRLGHALAMLSLCVAIEARAAAPEALYATAAEHYGAQRYGDAVIAFRQLVKAHGQHPAAADARFFLAESLLQTGDNKAAAAEFAAFAAAHPQHRCAAQASFREGEIAYLAGDYAAALPKLTAFLDQHADHVLREYALPYLAECQLEQGDATAARVTYQQAIKDYPRGALAEECRQGLARATAVPEAKVKPSNNALVSDAEAQGRKLLAQRQFAKAIEVLAPLASVKHERQSQRRLLLALAQLGDKQHDEALATLASIDVDEADDDVAASTLAARGAALVALGKGEEALVPLQQYLELFPSAGEARQCRAQLCIALAQAKQFDQADLAWKQFATKHATDPALAPTKLFLAESAAEAREFAAAQAWFDELDVQSTSETIRERARAGLAWLAQQERQPVAKKAADNSPAAAFRRAASFEKSGEHDNALAAYLAFIKAHADQPQLPEALLAAARLHDERNQDKEALALLQRIIDDHPQFAKLDAAHYQAAWVLLDLKRPDEAAKHFVKLHGEHRESPYWPDAAYRLAEHQARNKRYEEATKLLDELIAASPNDELLCHALYLKGQVAASSQQWAAVVPPLEQLLTKYPRHELRFIARYWLAEAEYRSGNYRAAGVQFADLAKDASGRKDPWIPLVALRQAQVLAHEGRWQEAHDVAAAIATKHPDFRQQYEADYLLGRCLGALSKFADARKALQRVIDSPTGGRTETAAMAQWMIGETHFQEERYDDAIAAYHRCEKLFPFERWQAASLLQAGKCHESKGRYRDAIGLYASVMKQHPQTTFAEEASQRLRVAEERASAKANRIE